MESIEKEKGMPYVTSFERLAKAEGLEQGVEQGLEQGFMVGQIVTLQRLLGLEESRKEELLRSSKEELVDTLASLSLRIKVKFGGELGGVV